MELWFWNGLPNDARPVTGYLFAKTTKGEPSEILGVNGTGGPSAPGRLFVKGEQGQKVLAGTTEIKPKTWHHLVLVRTGGRIAVYLDGNPRPEIAGEIEPGTSSARSSFVFGGRHDRSDTWEGKLDEIALYDRALRPAEIAEHFHAATTSRDDVNHY